MDISLQDRIRERAYEIWNAGGRLHGEAEQHWLAAERQVLSEMTGRIGVPTLVIKEKPVRQRRSVTNIRPQPKKAANAS